MTCKFAGYSDKKIEQFETSSPDPVSQVHNMLVHWAKHKHSTVGVLIKALKNISCHDIVKILHNDITEIKTSNHLQHIV